MFAVALLLLAEALTGCAAGPTNPSFPLDVSLAREALSEMESNPRMLPRPVVIMGGWADPGFCTSALRQALQRMADHPQILTLSFAFAGSFEDCRQKVIDAIDRAFPSLDPEWTTEVDVVAFSMGGLVARYAAQEETGSRRLRVANLYTISTPHRGAEMARWANLDPIAREMQVDSTFVTQLNQADSCCDYEMYPYVRLGDVVVGCENAAPPDQTPWWVPNMPLQLAHLSAPHDPRILADIMRRLRSERPFATEPRTPIPTAD